MPPFKKKVKPSRANTFQGILRKYAVSGDGFERAHDGFVLRVREAKDNGFTGHELNLPRKARTGPGEGFDVPPSVYLVPMQGQGI